MPRYLIVFTHDNHWIDFREAELEALLDFNGIRADDTYPVGTLQPDTAFLEIDLPNEDIVHNVCARSIMIKAIYELWGAGSSVSAATNVVSSKLPSLVEPHLAKSFSIEVDAFYRTLVPAQKQWFREKFDFLELQGVVNVVSPELTLCLMLDFSKNMHCSEAEFDTIPAYFGRLIARGGMKEAIRKYDLKKRAYLGPTSLDHHLALILANMAGVRPGYLALDPFVGTGSILIALTHFGAKCTGTDIDPRVLRGEMHAGKQDSSLNSKTRNILGNFRDYGLEAPELIRLDNHMCDRHYHFSNVCCAGGTIDDGLYNCIVTDPPYGIRAGAKKSGRKEACPYTISAERREDHVPSTQNYPVEEVMLDLLHSAARLLTINGKLLYLIPTTYDFELSDLPVHPCLTIDKTCEQRLSSRHGRRAVLMTKRCQYTPERVDEFMRYKESVTRREDAGFGRLIDKLERALAANAFEDAEVVKRASNGCVRRKESKAKKILKRKQESMAGSAGAATVVTTSDNDSAEPLDEDSTEA